MNTPAKAPLFNTYADVIKAVETAQSKVALCELAELVDVECFSERLHLGISNLLDLDNRMLLRKEQIEALNAVDGAASEGGSSVSQQQDGAAQADPVRLAIELLQAQRPDLAAAVQQLVVQVADVAPSETTAPIVVIESGGGLINCIRCSVPVEIIQLEADVEDGDPESQVLLSVGEQEYALSMCLYREEVAGGYEGIDVEYCHQVREMAAAKLSEYL